VMM